MITQSRLKELITYSEGMLYWKNPSKRRKSLDPKGRAGSRHHTGYRSIMIDGRSYQEHRIVFFYHNGYFPQYVDHINGVRDDNRIENLRPATKQQNGANADIYSSNTTGFRGVSYKKRQNKYESYVRFHGKKIHLGTFASAEEAFIATQNKRKELHGEFFREGGVS